MSMFHIGDHVRTQNLDKLPHFNGKLAVILTNLDGSGKHKVQLRPKGQNLKLFPTRLLRVTEDEFYRGNPDGDPPKLVEELKQAKIAAGMPVGSSTDQGRGGRGTTPGDGPGSGGASVQAGGDDEPAFGRPSVAQGKITPPVSVRQSGVYDEANSRKPPSTRATSVVKGGQDRITPPVAVGKSGIYDEPGSAGTRAGAAAAPSTFSTSSSKGGQARITPPVAVGKSGIYDEPSAPEERWPSPGQFGGKAGTIYDHDDPDIVAHRPTPPQMRGTSGKSGIFNPHGRTSTTLGAAPPPLQQEERGSSVVEDRAFLTQQFGQFELDDDSTNAYAAPGGRDTRTSGSLTKTSKKTITGAAERNFAARRSAFFDAKAAEAIAEHNRGRAEYVATLVEKSELRVAKFFEALGHHEIARDTATRGPTSIFTSTFGRPSVPVAAPAGARRMSSTTAQELWDRPATEAAGARPRTTTTQFEFRPMSSAGVSEQWEDRAVTEGSAAY
eukprot:g12175.t1